MTMKKKTEKEVAHSRRLVIMIIMMLIMMIMMNPMMITMTIDMMVVMMMTMTKREVGHMLTAEELQPCCSWQHPLHQQCTSTIHPHDEDDGDGDDDDDDDYDDKDDYGDKLATPTEPIMHLHHHHDED